MKEFMYDIDVGLIAIILLASTALALELGYRVGFRFRERTDTPSRQHIHQTETATVGLLALLLAFTLSQSLQRYDSRSDQVVDEANAIGTAWLRIDLLPPSLRDEVRSRMREYIDLKVKAGTVSTVQVEETRAIVAETGRLQTELWSYAARAAELDPSPVRTGLFVQARMEAYRSITFDASLAFASNKSSTKVLDGVSMSERLNTMVILAGAEPIDP
jgi:hypothetical protein